VRIDAHHEFCLLTAATDGVINALQHYFSGQLYAMDRGWIDEGDDADTKPKGT
jgi:hypothetical protein